MRKYIKLFFIGSRIPTWPVSLIPTAMATALAYKQTGFFDKSLFFFTLLSVLFIQIAVNLFNDAFDGKEGLDHERSGPLRLVSSNLAGFSEVKIMAFVSCFLSCLFAIPLILKGGLIILFMGLLSLLCCYFYTGSKWSFLKLGLSEAGAVIFFGFFIVCGVYYLQSLSWSGELVYLSLQCGFWALSFLLFNHLRDEEVDRKKGRKHFVTLYGKINSILFLCVIQAIIYLLCFYWLGLGLKAGAFSFFISPLSAFMLYSWNKTYVLLLAGLSYSLFGFFWIFGLLY